MANLFRSMCHVAIVKDTTVMKSHVGKYRWCRRWEGIQGTRKKGESGSAAGLIAAIIDRKYIREAGRLGAYYGILFLFLWISCGFVLLSVATFIGGQALKLTMHLVERHTNQ